MRMTLDLIFPERATQSQRLMGWIIAMIQHMIHTHQTDRGTVTVNKWDLEDLFHPLGAVTHENQIIDILWELNSKGILVVNSGPGRVTIHLGHVAWADYVDRINRRANP